MKKSAFIIFLSFFFAATLSAADMLVNVSDDDTGTCTNGGQKIEVGKDEDGNGTLDENNEFGNNEIENTKFVCNGEDGAATAISVTENPDECGAAGGFKVSVNGNDFFACNGADGDDTFVTTSTFEGSEGGCENGGIKIEVGKNNTVIRTEYVCNGEKGDAGKDGNNVLVKMSEISETEKDEGHCKKSGGVKIEIYIDKNNSGKIDDGDEIVKDQTQYICNGEKGTAGSSGTTGPKGEDGADGKDGAPGEQGEKGDTGAKGDQGEQGETGAKGENGTDGTSSLVAVVDEPKGENCATGGKKISVGLDSNRNGTLDEDEIDPESVYYVCNGRDAEEAGLSSSSTGCSLDTVDENISLISVVFALLTAVCALFGFKIVRR